MRKTLLRYKGLERNDDTERTKQKTQTHVRLHENKRNAPREEVTPKLVPVCHHDVFNGHFAAVHDREPGKSGPDAILFANMADVEEKKME